MAKKLERENLLNKKIKKFNFVEKLGTGSYGTVYKAVNTKTNQIIAIKAMSKSEIKEQPKLQRLVASQIAILKQVKNQNVIRFIDSFSTDESIFIATQFCNGGDLEKYCKQHGKLEQNQAIIFLKQILNGFKGLHEINTMHRDFKLANVLLHDNVCKIADLGFAKQIRDKSLTKTLLGTDETMAPEVHENKQYGWSADIWSLGVVFYQMLYGRLPYPGFNDHEILRKIKMTKPNYSDVDISQEALDFIKQCLVIDPAKRITWKQIYNHPIMYKSDITLTKALLRSRISLQGHKTYYQKNEQNQRKTIRQQDLDKMQTIETSRDKSIFENAGQIKNADHKAETIKKNKQQLQAQFAQYETEIIHTRNNKMFGITQVLPLQKQFLQITSVSHSLPLYHIVKHCYIEIKQFHQDILGDGFRQKFKYWKQFKQENIYKKICEQLLTDQIFAENLTVGYKWGLGDVKDNMNRKTSQSEYNSIVEKYKKQLTPYLKEQSRKSKPKFIKMLKALQKMLEEPSFKLQQFQRITENIDVEQQAKRLLQNT